MIDELHVENLALIKEATLSPSSRMTVLTGETGAGKTALLSACRLVMGARSDKSMVREGESDALCEIRLFVKDTQEKDDLEIIAMRKISADGRSRCKIDGSMASVTELTEVVAPHIDLCSQHDQQLLASTYMQRSLLDSWANVEDSGLKQAYVEAFNFSKEKKQQLDDVMAYAKSSDERLNDAKRIYMQISALNPSVEDYDQIAQALKKAENAELLARTSSEARDAINGEEGAIDNLNAAVALLEEGGRADESLTEMANTLREAIYVAEDVARDVTSYSTAIELDVGELEFMQERMAAYQSILRAFGPTLDDVFQAQREASKVIDASENADRTIEDAKRAYAEAEEKLHKAADGLSEARLNSAPAFADSANAVLDQLNMQGAKIEFQFKKLSRDAWTEDGSDEVRMMFVPASGMQPRQLSRIASGGELSRVMLAIRVAIGERDNVDTLVFDEIDAGVGGESALALADVLSKLSQSHQVIVVTHLPQIAAKADLHYLVEKKTEGDAMWTDLERLQDDKRVNEIARMLSGSITESSLAHSRELLGI